MQALFLRADLRTVNGEYFEAMSDALRANEISEQVADEEWIALSCEQIADLFTITQNSNEALPYREKAIIHYHNIGKERNERFSVCDKAVELERLNLIDASIQLMDSIISLAIRNPIDHELLSYCYLNVYPSLYRNQEYDRTLNV